MKRAACPWRLDLTGAHVQPTKWMLAVQSAQQDAAPRAVHAARPARTLQMPRLARPATPARTVR